VLHAALLELPLKCHFMEQDRRLYSGRNRTQIAIDAQFGRKIYEAGNATSSGKITKPCAALIPDFRMPRRLIIEGLFFMPCVLRDARNDLN